MGGGVAGLNERTAGAGVAGSTIAGPGGVATWFLWVISLTPDITPPHWDCSLQWFLLTAWPQTQPLVQVVMQMVQVVGVVRMAQVQVVRVVLMAVVTHFVASMTVVGTACASTVSPCRHHGQVEL